MSDDLKWPTADEVAAEDEDRELAKLEAELAELEEAESDEPEPEPEPAPAGPVVAGEFVLYDGERKKVVARRDLGRVVFEGGGEAFEREVERV